MRRVPKTLTVLFLLIISIVPAALPVNAAIHTYYLGNSTVGSCSGRCENLPTIIGTADTATSQSISTTTGDFMIEPDISASATGTQTTSTPSGYAWETPSAIGGSGGQIVSGIWNFDLTVGSSASTGTASVWITVWSCQTASEGTCAFLFKNWDNTTNVISTGPTQRNYVTGTVGPFNSVQFLVVEYWIHVTVAGASGEIVSETTVSSASDVGTQGSCTHTRCLRTQRFRTRRGSSSEV